MPREADTEQKKGPSRSKRCGRGEGEGRTDLASVEVVEFRFFFFVLFCLFILFLFSGEEERK